jgi:Tfp pilus assembly protein PilX
MKTKRRPLKRRRKGVALIVSMIFVFIFAALGVAFCAVSGTNAQISDNQRTMNISLASTDSGLNVVRFWLNRVSIPGSVPPSSRIENIAAYMQSDLANNGISNIQTNYESSTITIPAVCLDSATGQSFTAQITQPETDILQLDVTGTSGVIDRIARVTYNISPRTSTAFDFGVASRGPLQMSGNVELGSINISVESSVFIESENGETALSMSGNSQIAGDVSISDTNADVELGNHCSIGGETGEDALDHVSLGAESPEFPTPQPGYFEHYAVNTILEGGDDTIIENARIPAGVNPSFSGGTVIRGVLFIEQPNVVTFTGHCEITAIIVGDGDISEPSTANQIVFQGTVDSYDVSNLPDEPQFADIRMETGTFLMAPGFSAEFGGNFSALSGAIVASGIEFSGNAGGTINGSVINYSDEPMVLGGNSDLIFNRSENGQVPVGFTRDVVLHYAAESYSEMQP